MRKPLFCVWNHNESYELREKKRNSAIKYLNLNSQTVIPIFEEATQTAAHSLNIPVSCLGILVGEKYQLKSAHRLSDLALMNELTTLRQIKRQDALATYVIDSQSYLMIENTATDYFFSHHILCQKYGIISYLGIPLTIANGTCIGCLEVIDIKPRKFTAEELNFLTIIARWCIAEYERNHLLIHHNNDRNSQIKSDKTIGKKIKGNVKSDIFFQEISFYLLNQISQKLSIPLTSIIGMSSVLKQEIYGGLNSKQMEYLQIIYDSGQEMVNLVEEIVNLVDIKNFLKINYIPVDLENLGRQVIKSLEYFAHNKEHHLRLSIAPSDKIANLDGDKLKKTLYYLLITIIESARSGSEIQIHISRRKEDIKINCWIVHSWLGDGISWEKIDIYQSVLNNEIEFFKQEKYTEESETENKNQYDLICLLFSSYLARLQGGNISLQGSLESGYRFLLSIPLSHNSSLEN